MQKKHELTDKKSCLNKAKSNEWLFVLLGRDEAAPETIRYWCRQRVRLGKNKKSDPQIREALACAHEIAAGLLAKQMKGETK